MNDKTTNASFTAELLVWGHPVYNPAYHLGVRIQSQGKEHYFSFSPISLDGTTSMSLGELHQGRESYAITSYDNEKLIWGLRKKWIRLRGILSDEQKALLPNDLSIAQVSDKILLDVAVLFPSSIQSELSLVYEPEKISLNHCDVTTMIKKIKHFCTDEGRQLWAPWAGSLWRNKDTHNCASIILEILYAGKLKRFAHSMHDILGVVGAFIGFSVSLIIQPEVCLLSTLGAFIIGRVLGGAYEGYVDIEYYLQMRKLLKKDSAIVIIGFKVLSSILCAVAGVFIYGPIFPALITMPINVVALAKK